MRMQTLKDKLISHLVILYQYLQQFVDVVSVDRSGWGGSLQAVSGRAETAPPLGNIQQVLRGGKGVGQWLNSLFLLFVNA